MNGVREAWVTHKSKYLSSFGNRDGLLSCDRVVAGSPTQSTVLDIFYRPTRSLISSMEDLYNRLLISTTHFDVIYVIFVSLGGEAAIDAVVERFYDILLADDRVSGLFANTDMKHQRAMQKMFLNHVFGGKQYDGKNMRDAHSRLSLTDDHFNAVAEDLIRTLNELGVPQDKIDAVMAVVATTKNDVLGRSA